MGVGEFAEQVQLTATVDGEDLVRPQAHLAALRSGPEQHGLVFG